MTLQISPIADLSTQDAALARFVTSVKSAFGSLAKAGLLTKDDLDAIGLQAKKSIAARRTAQPGDLVLDIGGGLTGSLSAIEVAAAVLNTQAFKDALARAGVSTTTSSGTGNSASASDLDIRMQASIERMTTLLDQVNAAAELAQSQNADTQQMLDRTASRYRGPIRSFGVAGAWSDATAAQCVYWMWFNGGTGSPPTFPSNITDYLVIGDTVVIRDNASGPSTFIMSKQWLGHTIGWVTTPNTVNFHDVVNLDTFLTNVASVIPASGQLASSTVIAGTGKTLAQVASYRSPYITTCHVGGGTGIPAVLNGDVASWSILYLLNGSVNPGFRSGMPTAYLIYGDTVTFHDDGTGSNIGALSWNGSYWA